MQDGATRNRSFESLLSSRIVVFKLVVIVSFDDSGVLYHVPYHLLFLSIDPSPSVFAIVSKRNRHRRDSNHRPHPRSKTDALDRSATVGRQLELLFMSSKTGSKIPLPLSPKSPWMLDKSEVLAEVTEQPRFLPWQLPSGTNCTTSQWSGLWLICAF